MTQYLNRNKQNHDILISSNDTPNHHSSYGYYEIKVNWKMIKKIVKCITYIKSSQIYILIISFMSI